MESRTWEGKMRKIKSKRGVAQSFSILFLVLGAIVLVGFTIFRFYLGVSAVQESLEPYQAFEELLSRENFAKKTLYVAGEEIVVKGYEDFAKSGGYILNAEQSSSFNNYLGFTDLRTPESMKTILNGALYPEMENKRTSFLSTGERINLNLAHQMSRGFSFGYSSKGIILAINSWDETEQRKGLYIFYRTPVSLEFNFIDMGLHSFEDVWAAKEECEGKATEAEIEKCFENRLPNFKVDAKDFVVDAQGKRDYFKIDLESRRTFFLDGSFRKVKFGFIVDLI